MSPQTRYKDIWAIIMVTIILPLAMYGMRGKAKSSTKIAAVVSVLVGLCIFGVIGLSLVYASTQEVNLSAAVYTSAVYSAALLCPMRIQSTISSRSDTLRAGLRPIIINVAGPNTGGGWWRETLRSFAAREGLVFGDSGDADISCSHDAFQIEDYSDDLLLSLPRPSRISLIVRDPRSVVLEMYLTAVRKCQSDKLQLPRLQKNTLPVAGHSDLRRLRRMLIQEEHKATSLHAVCNASKEEGINIVIRELQQEGCRGSLAYACVANGLAAQVLQEENLRVFKYEDLWGNSEGFTSIGSFFGLQGKQLKNFVNVGQLWTEDFRRLFRSSHILQAREIGAWRNHFTASNRESVMAALGNAILGMGYSPM